jgi:hypothetical protein
MRRYVPIVILVVALAVYGLLFPGVWDSRELVRSNTPAGYIIPSKFSRILALGNQGLLSDFLFLKIATFVGGRSSSGSPLNEEDWQYVIRSLEVVTDLDPYFVDPYMLAEGLLAWDAGKPEAANQILMKGMKYRTSDWRLPFFVGFNNFYFLKNFEAASGFIMTASQLPGSPAYLATLGARLAYYGGKSKTALLFLQQMLADTDDVLLKKRLQMRLQALERAVLIEDALEQFKNQKKRLPKELSELVTTGYLITLPLDPYGGKWGILKNGRVFSTSKFANSPAKKPSDQPPNTKE